MKSSHNQSDRYMLLLLITHRKSSCYTNTNLGWEGEGKCYNLGLGPAPGWQEFFDVEQSTKKSFAHQQMSFSRTKDIPSKMSPSFAIWEKKALLIYKGSKFHVRNFRCTKFPCKNVEDCLPHLGHKSSVYLEVETTSCFLGLEFQE